MVEANESIFLVNKGDEHALVTKSFSLFRNAYQFAHQAT